MSLIGLFAGLCLLAVLFGLVEWKPAQAPRRWMDRSVRTDVAFWFFTPIMARTFSRLAVALALASPAALVGWRVDIRHLESLLTASGPLARHPRWLQSIEVLLVADGLGYWMHRLFHGRTLWRFHAVHHGSEHLD